MPLGIKDQLRVEVRAVQESSKDAGLRIGNFGLFASGLLAVSLGLAGFCISCFVAILAILVWNRGAAPGVDFADSYKYVALPVGIAVTVVSGIILLGLWVRRMVR